MPNIITHTLFAQEIFDKVDENKHDLFEPRLHLLEIGSNGPDFLFFHGMNPKDFFKKSDLRVSGSMFHAGHVNEFYQKALISIRNESDEEIKKDMMTSFMSLGIGCDKPSICVLSHGNLQRQECVVSSPF